MITKLKNVGNTCFINSILQCLSIPELHEWFKTATKDSLLFNEYKDIQNMMVEYESIIPNRFVNIVYHQLHFTPGQQGDAHELLLYLLDEMDCPLFKGKQISHLSDTNTEEAFFSLEVPVMPTLEQSIQSYMKPEEVEWMNKKVLKWYEIIEYPHLLWITLKRFDNQNNKNDELIQIPFEIGIYELIAICNHDGNTNYGHYTAMVKRDQWYECNDEDIHPVTPTTRHAYCLLFRKKTV